MPKRKRSATRNAQPRSGETVSRIPKNEATEEEINIEVNGRVLPGVFCLPGGCINTTGVILTHGAGGDMNTPQLVYVSRYLSSKGYVVLRFTCKGLNIGYRTNMYAGVLEYMYGRADALGIKNCVLAGRSMGSRAAVNVANQCSGESPLHSFVAGVFCLAYPLHPPDKPQELRDTPLLEMTVPCLFLSGTDDKFAIKKKMDATVGKMTANVDMQWLDGVDHGHTIKKGQDLEHLICDTIDQWMKGL